MSGEGRIKELVCMDKKNYKAFKICGVWEVL